MNKQCIPEGSFLIWRGLTLNSWEEEDIMTSRKLVMGEYIMGNDRNVTKDDLRKRIGNVVKCELETQLDPELGELEHEYYNITFLSDGLVVYGVNGNCITTQEEIDELTK